MSHKTSISIRVGSGYLHFPWLSIAPLDSFALPLFDVNVHLLSLIFSITYFHYLEPLLVSMHYANKTKLTTFLLNDWRLLKEKAHYSQSNMKPPAFII